MGKTVRELASMLDVEHSTVARWVSGKKVPTGQNLQRLVQWSQGPHGATNPTPAGLTAADVRGIRYAAEAMSFTLGELLKTARELEAPGAQRSKAPLPDWITAEELASDLALADQVDARRAEIEEQKKEKGASKPKRRKVS